MRTSLIVFLVTISFNIFAQDHFAYLAWDINTPLSSRDWIGATSSAGGNGGIRFFLPGEKISVGLDVVWNTFHEYKPTQTFPTENGAITTDYFNYLSRVGALATAQYYFMAGKSDIIFPYAGLGLGANRNVLDVYYNIYSDSRSAWGFLARPEAGVVVKFGKYRSLGAIAAVHLDYSSVRQKDYGYSGLASAGFKIGFVLMSQ